MCPEECLECCQERGWGKRGFKCLLKSYDGAVPANRDCTEPEDRRDLPMSKTTCQYLPGEGKVPEKKCSANFACCCQAKPVQQANATTSLPEGVEKEVCADLPEDGNTTIVRNDAVYELADSEENPATYLNYGPCVDPDYRAVTWQLEEAPDSTKAPVTAGFGLPLPFKLNSCCLKAKMEVVTHRWKNTSLTNWAGGWRTKQGPVKQKRMMYKVCKSFEVLFKCSKAMGDLPEGVRSSGQRLFVYKEPVAQAGLCIGDLQKKMDFDGENAICDGSCKCEANCGINFVSLARATP